MLASLLAGHFQPTHHQRAVGQHHAVHAALRPAEIHAHNGTEGVAGIVRHPGQHPGLVVGSREPNRPNQVAALGELRTVDGAAGDLPAIGIQPGGPAPLPAVEARELDVADFVFRATAVGEQGATVGRGHKGQLAAVAHRIVHQHIRTGCTQHAGVERHAIVAGCLSPAIKPGGEQPAVTQGLEGHKLYREGFVADRQGGTPGCAVVEGAAVDRAIAGAVMTRGRVMGGIVDEPHGGQVTVARDGEEREVGPVDEKIHPLRDETGFAPGLARGIEPAEFQRPLFSAHRFEPGEERRAVGCHR